MQNHSFNTPTTLPSELKRRKDELSAEMDALKHAGQLPRKDHVKAILGIRHAETIEEVEAIVKPYTKAS